MDRRLVELRERLWKKKAALQQSENQPVSLYRKKISAKVDFYNFKVFLFVFCTKHLFLLCCCLLNIQVLIEKAAAVKHFCSLQVASDCTAPQYSMGSRVAAVGPYIQSSSTSSSQGPPVPVRQEILVKPAYPDGTVTLPMADSSLKPPPRPVKPASGTCFRDVRNIFFYVLSLSQHAETLFESELVTSISSTKTLLDVVISASQVSTP